MPELKVSESWDFEEKEGIGGVTNSWYTQQVVMRFFKYSRFSGLKTKQDREDRMMYMKRVGVVCVCLAVFATQSWGETVGPIASSSSTPSTSAKVTAAITENSQLIVTPEYILGPEDVLEISVWKNNDLSKQVQVRPDGRISLPLVGDVSAVGKTASQLTDEISGRLRAYMENPTVSILVREVNSYQIYVLGEVNKPGKYPLKSKLTLLQAVTVAGGFTPVAARNKIVVFRFGKESEGMTKIKASYDDIVIRDGSNQNIELKPGDLIVVPSETMVVLPSR